MKSCYEITKLLSDSQERKLTIKEQAHLKLHTAMCSACRRFGLHMAIIRQAMQQYAAGENEHK